VSKKIIGTGAAMRLLRERLALAAQSLATVLVTGESGTGKELVARAIHDLSPRCGGPFVPINCGSIPRDLLESELFGHIKGSFSGAIADRKGRFELARGGTIFLDEIGDMPAVMQVKLLRVLQEGVVDPVGGAKSVAVDVRVVAATHRDLETECTESRFREDLYFRLNVLPIRVPALRERTDDLPQLISHFIVTHTPQEQLRISLAPCLTQALHDYDWPGNIRELSNLIQRLSVLMPGKRLSVATVSRDLLPRKMKLVPMDVSVPLSPENVLEERLRPTEEGLPLQPQNTEALSQPLEKSSIGSKAESESMPNDIFSSTNEVDALFAAGSGQEFSNSSGQDEDNPVEEIIMIAHGGSLFKSQGIPLKNHLADIEKKIIERALNYTGGNVSKTAQLLHLQRTTLIQKMNKIKSEGNTP
jgi:sigma-54 specific flagellar transcriptional regulator A